MHKTTIALTVVALFASSALAVPLGVRIDDNDFTFDTDVVAEYQYNGAKPDRIYVGPEGYEVGSYRVISLSVFGLQPGFYPVWGSLNPVMFGGDLVLDMEFDVADGPYFHYGSDVYEVSLEGSKGFLEIYGYIGNTIEPNAAPKPLVRIDFSMTSLLARAGVSLADLVEGYGKLSIWDPTHPEANGEGWFDTGLDGVTFFKFMAEEDPFTPLALFPDLGPTEFYNPAVDYNLNPDPAIGRVSGETGTGTFTPEPATLAMLGLGAAALIRRRRR